MIRAILAAVACGLFLGWLLTAMLTQIAYWQVNHAEAQY